jgi:nicotinamidase-related amidase
VSSALVLVDVINDFFDADGVNYDPSYVRLHEPINRLVVTALESNRPVVHVVERHRPGPDFEFAKLPVHCLEGSWDAAVAPWLAEHDRHIVVPKRRYSGFFRTDLDLLLRERVVSRLVVAGVKSHVCVRATIQDAFAYGYDVLLPREATGSNRQNLHEASLEDIDRYMGRVVSLTEGLEALRAEDGL